MRVLLIGGTGFIGPFVAAELARLGHEVVVFHRGRTHGSAPTVPGGDAVGTVTGTDPARKVVGADPRVGPREIFGDRRRLADSATELRALAPDVVIDLILSSGAQARELMTVFRGATSRVVALSSCDVYRACGVTHGLEEGPLEPLPLTETSALRTKLQTYPAAQVQMLQQIFGWLDDAYDKIPVEREILAEHRGAGAPGVINDLPGTILRLPMVYGPRDPLHRFHPIVKRVVDNRRAILFSADMAQWRATKGYVENVAAAIALAAVSNRAAGRIYNVGEIDTLSELEWAERIAAALGWTSRFTLLPDARLPPYLRAPGNTKQHWVADTTRLREELGFQERVPRDEAIRRTVEWERAHPPTGFTPHQFDYAAEDAALSSRPISA
ncbi:MAG TPA: NAD-dependent epimerase/dehydratase family protein [Vicinamibacterales bacterium]|jgi:nucleoside-diphosphate-sugar epimerase|nr:NAD-dependent epimerase/dehydratase family protein [Vicinamibacterales bacterium]